MLPVKIDVTRPYAEVEKIKQRLKTVENFINQKWDILESAQPSIQIFMEKFGATEMSLGNMYSSGGVTFETYSEDCGLIGHGVLTLKKEYVNKGLLQKKLSASWKEIVPSTVVASFWDYKITGCTIKFSIYIK